MPHTGKSLRKYVRLRQSLNRTGDFSGKGNGIYLIEVVTGKMSGIRKLIVK